MVVTLILITEHQVVVGKIITVVQFPVHTVLQVKAGLVVTTL